MAPKKVAEEVPAEPVVEQVRCMRRPMATCLFEVLFEWLNKCFNNAHSQPSEVGNSSIAMVQLMKENGNCYSQHRHLHLRGKRSLQLRRARMSHHRLPLNHLAEFAMGKVRLLRTSTVIPHRCHHNNNLS